jgi:hypothetical protein
MGHGVAQLLDVVQVTEQYLVIDCRSELAWSEKVHRVQVSDVHPPGVRRWTLGSVLLHVHAKEAHVRAVHLFECEQRFGSVGKLVRQLTRVDESAIRETQE